MRMASEFPAAAPVGFLVIVSLCSVAASLLPVGVLHGDLAVLEREHVAALDLDANAVVPGAGKHPFGHAPVPRDEVSRPAPCGVRELLEYPPRPLSGPGVDRRRRCPSRQRRPRLRTRSLPLSPT